MDLKDITTLFKKYDIRPLKRFGQNFLISKKAFKKIIEVADIKKEDVILEIGPGIGNLTKILAQKAKKVIAIEKDKKMCEILKETLKEFKNIEVINQDILKYEIQTTKKEKGKTIFKSLDSKKTFGGRTSESTRGPSSGNYNNYKVVANLPYYIVSPVIRKFLESENQPESMVLMVQKEVAERITAKPPKMNILAVSVQFYSEPKIISNVSKKSFYPKPNVDSAIIKLSSIKKSKINQDLFFKIVKAGFSQKRKQLINNLSLLKDNKEEVKKWLLKNKIDYKKRAERLTIEDWIKLTKTFLF